MVDPIQNAIKEAMAKQGITQERLAEQLKTNQPAVSRALHRPVFPPTSLLGAILETLGLELTVQKRGDGH